MTRPPRYRLALAAAVLLAGAQSAPAGAVSCTVTSQGVAFGSYDSLTRTTLDGAGSISVSCDEAATMDIALDPGGSGTFSPRRMTGGAADMTYNLYANSSRTAVWGDGSGGTTTVAASGASGELTVYGRIDAGQNLPAGTYADTVVVTVTY